MDRPTFSGILTVGQTLSSYAGEWERAQTLKYQWLRDGAVIPGAQGETYDITEADDGRSLALRVTGSAAGLEDGVTTTQPSPKVSATNTAVYTSSPAIVVTGEAPSVSGWTRVGFTLDVEDLGKWSTDTVALQWQADGVDIAGATTDSYKIRTADLGKVVTLKVTGGQPGKGSVSKSNTSTVVTRGYIHPTDEMWLSGGSGVGDTLSVKGSGGWYADGEPITLLYQWEQDGRPITGATAATYTVVTADQGHWIRAQVTATAPGHGPNTQSTLYVDITAPAPVDQTPVDQTPAPAPVKPAPAPAPAPVKQAPAPAPAQNEQSSVSHADTVRPTTRNVPAPTVVPAQASRGFVQPQTALRAESPIADAAGPVEAAAPAEAAPSNAAPATTAPAAAASPAPSSTPAAVATKAQAANTSSANPLPLVLWIAGVLIAAGLVWVIRPLRASVIRLVARKAP